MPRAMKLIDVKPSEVTIKVQIAHSPNSWIFLVTIRGVMCVMKVVSMSLAIQSDYRNPVLLIVCLGIDPRE